MGEQNVKGQLINYSGRIVYPASKGRYTVRITLQAGFKVNVLKALRLSSTHGRKTLQYIIITTMYIIGAFKMKKKKIFLLQKIARSRKFTEIFVVNGNSYFTLKSN